MKTRHAIHYDGYIYSSEEQLSISPLPLVVLILVAMGLGLFLFRNSSVERLRQENEELKQERAEVEARVEELSRRQNCAIAILSGGECPKAPTAY